MTKTVPVVSFAKLETGMPMPHLLLGERHYRDSLVSFAKLETGMPMPHLLDIQTRAFQSLLQPDGKGAERSDVGLERVFKDLFPIQDVNGNYSLEFVKYALGEPKYSVE